MSLILILPLLASLIAQASKFFIKSNHLKPSLRNLIAYSGMPSGHAAMVVSLTTIIGLVEGLNSSIFAIAFVFAVLVIRDAVGIRKYLGLHGKIINRLIRDLGDDQVLEENYPDLLEKIGHTPLQVLVGAIIGFIVSLIGYLIF